MLQVIVVNTTFKGPWVSTEMMQVSLVVSIVGSSRRRAAEMILTTLKSRLLRIPFLQVGEVLIIDWSQGWVVHVETVACEVVVLLSILNLVIRIILLDRKPYSVSLRIEDSNRVNISLRGRWSNNSLRMRFGLLFNWHWRLLILFIIVLVTSNLEIHHEFFGMIQKRFIVIHLVLVYLHLTSLVVILYWWVYRSVTA